MSRLFAAFVGRAPAEADLVAYWFGKAWERVLDGRLKRAGLVATNSMRGGANRRVLDRIVREGVIFEAWDDEPWVVPGGPAVRVSLLCFGSEAPATSRLNGRPVQQINSDLTATSSDLTRAGRLNENERVCFEGCKKYGPFDVSGPLARKWLTLPVNPNGEHNATVLCPWLNAKDVARSSSDRWVVDFSGLDERAAALFEAPFSYAAAKVRPIRERDRNEITRTRWWLFERNRPDLREALKRVQRYIVTPIVAKHRLFAWVPSRVLPSNLLDAVVRADDTTFGILHSRFHGAWALRLGTSLEDRPRYTPSTTFETFPFPEGLTPNIPPVEYANDPRAAAIAEAARRLNELRENWLNPPDLVDRVPEVVPGYPDRLLPKNPEAAAILKKRTLTNLYNERPAWLDHAHRDLDAAVAAAYGWPADISEEDALARLLALNLERAAAGR
jgi:type II restriction/modification system DNA methylase subunit YeeA